jgi:hypothetical protein
MVTGIQKLLDRFAPGELQARWRATKRRKTAAS